MATPAPRRPRPPFAHTRATRAQAPISLLQVPGTPLRCRTWPQTAAGAHVAPVLSPTRPEARRSREQATAAAEARTPRVPGSLLGGRHHLRPPGEALGVEVEVAAEGGARSFEPREGTAGSWTHLGCSPRRRQERPPPPAGLEPRRRHSHRPCQVYRWATQACHQAPLPNRGTARCPSTARRQATTRRRRTYCFMPARLCACTSQGCTLVRTHRMWQPPLRLSPCLEPEPKPWLQQQSPTTRGSYSHRPAGP